MKFRGCKKEVEIKLRIRSKRERSKIRDRGEEQKVQVKGKEEVKGSYRVSYLVPFLSRPQDTGRLQDFRT